MINDDKDNTKNKKNIRTEKVESKPKPKELLAIKEEDIAEEPVVYDESH